jgi:hypothetical protein
MPPLAIIAGCGWMAICLAATPPSSKSAASPSPDEATPARNTPSPAKTSPEAMASPGKALAAAQVKALVKRWRAELAPWHEEDVHESADNSFCYVCHLNYEEENLVTIHQPVGVGCELCHGISDSHSEDEDNITPPDIMFPTAQIVPFCMECHSREDLQEEDSHDELLGGDADADLTCMKCHGKDHHLKVRTRRWNKLTGKLIWDDGVRMMEETP